MSRVKACMQVNTLETETLAVSMYSPLTFQGNGTETAANGGYSDTENQAVIQECRGIVI